MSADVIFKRGVGFMVLEYNESDDHDYSYDPFDDAENEYIQHFDNDENDDEVVDEE